METLPTAVQTIDLREPIPGYVLGERLGSGGFGEVWRADAPGGLAKAVKIVYGQMHGDRAEQELKALQKIKQVRHPMLLSLERIESVADHLVIVMELADGSLRDRQEERRATGLPGIPREELLAYLRDAADAMDYLVEHHSLLHLDIKPENLLLVADRVKVADFGLMRNVDEANASLVGGMTPLYAAPEVFDGQPHRQSDQYSLAIVYQELLTGEPPFSGRTPAQLISQHLHSQPNLKPLPTFDQPVIARALSKVAGRRFPNCRALVAELAKAPQATQRTPSRRRLGDAGQVQDTWRGAGTTTTSDPGRPAPTDIVSLAFPASTDLHDLPSIALETEQAFARPTLFVGVGGVGTRVLCRLKKRLRDKFGSVEEAEALQFLALETDPQALAHVSTESLEDGLRFQESLLLPLLDPQDYRAKSSSLLEWMNRRWLYNIPRSHKTEGIRALGRLAFVDHFGAVVDALHTALALATAPESLESTTRCTGLQFKPGPPRVFVVGSAAGGTGGGMLLDLGYTLRTLLNRMQLTDPHLCGILTHAAPLRAKARDLAVANTLALLGELKQFTEDRYPGEPACDLPAHEHEAPFAKTYFIHQGEAPDDAAIQRSVNEISDYLMLNTVTPAANFFERCRDESNAPVNQPEATTRTFGLGRIDCQSNNLMSIAVASLTGALLSRWTEYEQDSAAVHLDRQRGETEDKAHALSAKFAEMFDLTEMRVVDESMSLISRELGQDARQFVRKSLNDVWVQSSHIDTEVRIHVAIESIDKMTGGLVDVSAAVKSNSLSTMLDRQLQIKCRKTQEELQQWLARLVDTPGLRVSGARFACRWLVRHFERLEAALSSQMDRLKETLRRLTSGLLDEASDPVADPSQQALVGVNSKTFQDLREYALATLEAACYRGTIRAWQKLRETTLESDRRLRSLSQSAQSLASQISDSCKDPSIEQRSATTPQANLDAFRSRLPHLVATLDRELNHTHLGQLLFLDETVKSENVDLDNFARLIGQRAKAVLRRHFQEHAMDDGLAQGTYDVERFQECVNRALPSLTSCGGAKRVLVQLPADGELDAGTLSQDARLASESATTIVDGEGKASVCFEVEQISLANVAVSLIRNRADYLDLAARLHTRVDVDWKPFQSAAPPAPMAE